MVRRTSGILMHITSLPSRFGIGDMGPWSYRFADFLSETEQGVWQILPLNPTNRSPYHSSSAFAFNPMLISPELMVRDGFLKEEDLLGVPDFPAGRVDYPAVMDYKANLFSRAYEYFRKRGREPLYEEFCRSNGFWLDDFALFSALKSKFSGSSWSEWPHELKDRREDALETARRELRDRVGMEKFLQYVFSRQWFDLKAYCNERGIQIMGDIPIYVTYESADLWAEPGLFKLDEEKRPYVVAGVPPDYFSETGQLWGNPVYRWDEMKTRGYDWWIQRFARNLKLFDLVRVDHFRGFIGYWEIPATEENAINGKWAEAPGGEFFREILKKFPCFPVIAEDLGYITPDVREVIREFNFPGMKVLMFAFGEDLPRNPYIPHNLDANCVAYTGTHDNNTIRGWLDTEAAPEIKNRIYHYIGRDVPADEINWELIRIVMMSAANTVIFPMQDILGLGEQARMNRPSSREGNWEWRLTPEELTQEISERLSEMTRIYGRA